MAKKPNRDPKHTEPEKKSDQTDETLDVGFDPNDPASGVVAGDESTEEPKRLRQNLPPKKCPYHKDKVLVSGRSDPYFTRYYCQVDGCSYSEKVPRPKLSEHLKRAQDNEGYGAR